MSKTGELKRHGFSPSDCKEDDDRVAYLVLNASEDAFSDIGEIPEAEYLKKLYDEVIGETGYIRFMLTSMSDSRVEKQSIIPTTGDSFAATFTGAEPQLLTVQGYLVHEYRYDDGDSDNENVSDSMRTWYVDFMYLYEYYLRASRLAKWQSTITLNLPDYGSFDGYMLSVNTSMTAENDIVVPFSFQMLVVNRSGIKLSKAESILGSGGTITAGRNLRDDLSGTSNINGRRNRLKGGSVSISEVPGAPVSEATDTSYDKESVHSGLGIAGSPYATMTPTEPSVDMEDVAADQRLQELYKINKDSVTVPGVQALNSFANTLDSAKETATSLWGTAKNFSNGQDNSGNSTTSAIDRLKQVFNKGEDASTEDSIRWQDRARKIFGIES